MRPLTFPRSRILPEQDITEKAMHECVDLVATFDRAIAQAAHPERARQLLIRLQTCRDFLKVSEDYARAKVDALEALPESWRPFVKEEQR